MNMATNDDLDDFFKKKDRKKPKHTKKSGLLTNTQELLKQLEIVTIATSAFKENLDIEDDDDELPVNEDSVVGAGITEEIRKHPPKSNKTKIPDNPSNVLDLIPVDDPQQQDEWEDFESSNYKYEQLRLKFSRGNNNENEDDEYYDEENNLNNNDDNKDANNDHQQQQKDKPVWRTDQIKQEKEANATPPEVVEKPEEPPTLVTPKPATTGAYVPPARRGVGTGSSVTVVSGGNPTRPSKKKEPNFASIDEFPTLGATANKK